MKHPFHPIKTICVVVLLGLIAACANEQGRENMLVAAGFRVRIASTPQQIAHLKSLPAGKVTLVQRNGKVYYVFPDVEHNAAYIGQQQEYQNYQQLRLAKQLSNQNLEAAQMSEAPPIEWDVWGPGFWY